MAEYEALILGLKVLKELGAKRIAMHGDSELL
jgi:ribonuclease HI